VKVLLDTHVLLWWLAAPERLSTRASQVIGARANTLHWSAASSWEVAIKSALGRIELPSKPRTFLPRVLREQAIEALDITQAHALGVAELPPHHRDPFDRMLVVQARLEKLSILSADEVFERYDVRRIW
jgi:PIN domain nuclease of toxin-antitoxin system